MGRWRMDRTPKFGTANLAQGMVVYWFDGPDAYGQRATITACDYGRGVFRLALLNKSVWQDARPSVKTGSKRWVPARQAGYVNETREGRHWQDHMDAHPPGFFITLFEMCRFMELRDSLSADERRRLGQAGMVAAAIDQAARAAWQQAQETKDG